MIVENGDEERRSAYKMLGLSGDGDPARAEPTRLRSEHHGKSHRGRGRQRVAIRAETPWFKGEKGVWRGKSFCAKGGVNEIKGVILSS